MFFAWRQNVPAQSAPLISFRPRPQRNLNRNRTRRTRTRGMEHGFCAVASRALPSIHPHEFYCCRTCGCPSERSLPLDNAKSTLFGLMQQAQCTEYLDTPVCHLGPVCPANLFGEIFPDANEKEINLENKSTNIVIKMS